MAAAARSLNLSASAVAQQLRTLERELDVPLLIRIGRTVKITDQGSRILNHARQLVRDSANLRGLAHDGSIGGELRLGACSTALIGILPDLMAKVGGKYPDIRFRVESANSVQLYTQILAGNLDAACVLEAPYPLPKTCEWLLMRVEPLIVLAPARLATNLTVFVLAVVIGYYVIGKVHHALHTPLMSVTNAISGVIVVGALLQVGRHGVVVTVVALLAILLASINVVGGFAVTRRMLAMFSKDPVR